jgi:hypothetical protein
MTGERGGSFAAPIPPAAPMTRAILSRDDGIGFSPFGLAGNHEASYSSSRPIRELPNILQTLYINA